MGLKVKHWLVLEVERNVLERLRYYCKIQNHYQLAVAQPSFLFQFLYHMFCCSDIVVKTPQNLQVPNSSEESGCAAKNAFQEVPYSQRWEEVVLNRPEAAYKRLLEACGRMPHKSN